MRPDSHSYLISLLILWICIFISCKDTVSNDTNEALAFAGSNRPELERVLNHYAGDSLKYEAARFLIENMPGHYSYADTEIVDRFYDSIDSLLVALKGKSYAEITDSIKILYDRANADSFRLIEDARVITADFLIDNIDNAFLQWQTQPWCQHIDFDQFCELILPYKVAETQELKPWREEFAKIGMDSLERMSSCSLFRISSFQAAEFVNRCLIEQFEREDDEHNMPPLYYRPLTRLNIPYSSCEDLCQSGLNVFRAIGIPVVSEYLPLWGYGNRGHSWGIVHAPNGIDIAFVPIAMSPYEQHKVNETISKAYRRTYARNKELVELNDGSRYVPPTFRNIFQKDVTAQYADTKDLTIEIQNTDNEYIYLCSTTRSYWAPVAVAKSKDNKVTFPNLGKGCIYMPVCYNQMGEAQLLSEPFKFDWHGNVQKITPDFDNTVTAKLYRKGPLLEYAWKMAILMENGEFEASNDPTFRSKVSVGKVYTPADQAGEIIISDSIAEYRYWRYIQRGDEAKCYLGELTFYNNDENITHKGLPIGNYDKNACNTFEDGRRAFDGDVLTPVSFTREGEAWIGLDFGKPISINKLQYVPRSDGDMIEPGDEYEMLYWHKGQWNSLGRKIATTVSLTYDNVPTGAIYILIDRTKGKSERIFLLNEQGEQEWW